MSTLAPPHRKLERLSLTCPLGLRFADAGTHAPVLEGLRAQAWAGEFADRKIDAVRTPGGILAFHGLPGLRSLENSSAQDPWNPLPETRKFRLEVTDELARFLPCRFDVEAPARGLAHFAGAGSPPWSEDGAVPLFSVPSRRAPSLAVVRAELLELASGNPAAWAFVEAVYQSGGVQHIVRGLSDERGCLALMFPFPEGQARGFGGSSPPSGPALPPQQWTLSLHFFHRFPSANEPIPKTADFSQHLHQPPAEATLMASPITPLTSATLIVGRELNLGLLALAPI